MAAEAHRRNGGHPSLLPTKPWLGEPRLAWRSSNQIQSVISGSIAKRSLGFDETRRLEASRSWRTKLDVSLKKRTVSICIEQLNARMVHGSRHEILSLSSFCHHYRFPHCYTRRRFTRSHKDTRSWRLPPQALMSSLLLQGFQSLC